MAKRAEVFDKILKINLKDKKENIIAEILKIKEIIKLNKKETNNIYKKDYYSNHEVSIIRRKINNAKTAFKKDYHKRFESEKNRKKIHLCLNKIRISKEMLIVQNSLYLEKDEGKMESLKIKLNELNKEYENNLIRTIDKCLQAKEIS